MIVESKSSTLINNLLEDNNKTIMVSKSIRVSPFKFDSLLSQIRGKTVWEAEKILQSKYSNVRTIISKTLYGAESNLRAKFVLEGQLEGKDFFLFKKSLIVDEAFVNQGSILKRMQPRARGKAYKIEKKFSHLTLKLKTLTTKN